MPLAAAVLKRDREAAGNERQKKALRERELRQGEDMVEPTLTSGNNI